MVDTEVVDSQAEDAGFVHLAVGVHGYDLGQLPDEGIQPIPTEFLALIPRPPATQNIQHENCTRYILFSLLRIIHTIDPNSFS